MFTLLVAMNNDQVDRLVFPNYLDWFIMVSGPQTGNLRNDFMLTNTLIHPFQIGLAFAVDPKNVSVMDESFLRCMRKELPVVGNRVKIFCLFKPVGFIKLNQAYMT